MERPKTTRRAAGSAKRLSCVDLALLLCAWLLLVCVPMPARVRAQAQAPHPLKQDETCLACHGQAGMTSSNGKSISIDPAKHAASVHGTLACNDCHTTVKDYPHAAKVPKVQCSSCHAEEAAHVGTSIHAALGEGACQSCHGDPHEVAAATQTAPSQCAQCHADEVKEFRQSIHGQAAKAGDPDAPDLHVLPWSGASDSNIERCGLAGGQEKSAGHLRFLSQQPAVSFPAQHSFCTSRGTL